MKKDKFTSGDGTSITCAVSNTQEGRPWIVILIPFGLRLEILKAFFDFFEPKYQILGWESRSILDPTDRKFPESEFSIDNHVMDFQSALSIHNIGSCILVGYCSGAGIALAAANRFPDLVGSLILVHGEYLMLDDKVCSTQFAIEIDSLLSLASKGEKQLDQVFKKIDSQRIESFSERPPGIDLPFTSINYLRRYAANYLHYKKGRFGELASSISQKTLVMSGALDAQVGVASSEKIHNLIPDSEIYTDPASDHYDILREDSNTHVAIWNYLYGQRQ